MLQETEGPRRSSQIKDFNSVNLSTDVSLIALGIMACVCDRLFAVDRSISPDETNHAKAYILWKCSKG